MSLLLGPPHRRLQQFGDQSHVFRPLYSRSVRSATNNGTPQPLYQNNLDTEDQDEPPSYQRTNDGFQNNASLHSNNDVKSLIPLPDWPVALKRWGLCWDFHIYGYSVLFLVLTIVSAAIFLRFRKRVQRFKIVFNTLILLATAGIFRAVFMLVDPYGYKGRMAGLMVGIMTQAVYPLFCACYGLTQVMLLRITNVDVGHSRLRTLSCLLGCTLSYLFLVVVIETLVFYERSLKLLLLLDSGCFIVWSLSLGITFICSGFRLTQYATETKRARKELNAFSNHRRTASNTTGLSAISSTTNDNSINVISIDMTPSATDTPSLPFPTTASSETTPGDSALSASSPTCQSFTSSNPSSAHRSNTSVRLSRPKLKISDHNHMMITIATDDDDESTSSTDVDNPQHENVSRVAKRTKKKKTQKPTRVRSRSRSKTPTSPAVYSPVSPTEESSPTRKSASAARKRHKSGNSGSKLKTNNAASDYTSVSTIEKQDSEVNQSGNVCDSNAPQNVQKKQPHASDKTYATASELPLLASSILRPKRKEDDDLCESPGDDSDDEDEDKDSVYKDMSGLSSYCENKDSSALGQNGAQRPHALSFGMGLDVMLKKKKLLKSLDESTAVSTPQSNEHPYEALSQAESMTFSTPLDTNDPISSSPRENGYLADTENIFSCSSFSRISSSFQRQPITREDGGHVSRDESTRESGSSHSDEDSTTSPGLSERMRSSMSANMGLFRIRQSKVVQRAVHLTYFLTFLFMFACLLQLYTVFGVYGVLGTIPRPDPWPWLIFHTIFRATEVSIGFTIATIAFITLNHRHQRAKRRHQQQQHLEATRDCVV